MRARKGHWDVGEAPDRASTAGLIVVKVAAVHLSDVRASGGTRGLSRREGVGWLLRPTSNPSLDVPWPAAKRASLRLATTLWSPEFMAAQRFGSCLPRDHGCDEHDGRST